MIEEVFEMKKNDFRFVEENGRIFALETFGLVLFPNVTGIISLLAGDYSFCYIWKHLDKFYYGDTSKSYLNTQLLYEG